MQSALLDQSGFHLAEVELPKPGPDEILVKTLACGICGGDQHWYTVRGKLGDEKLALGHEGTGLIQAIGESVQGFAIGDYVTSLHGGFSEYFISKAEETMKVPEGMDPRFVLGEPVACCVHAADRFNIQEGAEVAIVGCGFMGLICMQLARLQGAGRIVAIDPVEYRRKMAAQLGAGETATPDEFQGFDPDVGLFDVVIEAGGVPSALNLSTDLVKHHGRAVLIGYHESNDGMRNVNVQRWNYKAIDVINGHVRRMDEKYDAMVRGVELIAAGKLNTEALVSEYRLGDIAEAFADINSPQARLFKAVLVPEFAG